MIRRAACLAIPTLLFFAACDPGDDADNASAGGDTATSDGPACVVGEFDCACLEGSICDHGLDCQAGICVEPPIDPTANSESADTSGSADEGGVDACSGDEACDLSEICIEETCIPVLDVRWEIIVTSFVPGGCRDGWGEAEIYYRYLEDGQAVSASSYAGCPADWSDEILDHDPELSFELEFWELDAIFDDEFGSLCWGDDADAYSCGRIPESILHDGGYAGPANGDAHYVEIVAIPALD